MAYSERARASTRRGRRRGRRVAGLLIVVAALAAVLGDRLPDSSSSTADPIVQALRRAQGAPPGEIRGAGPSGLGEADGAVPEGTSVFDHQVPGVAKLNADLRDALHRAAADAADDGVELVVDSGWRSPAYQEQLLRQAISKYGSEAQAARWVATPDTSAHVSGDAVDIGPTGAAAWLSERGGAYGLCRIYGNEPWHYELRPEAVDRGCPAMYADPTHDPRMQQR